MGLEDGIPCTEGLADSLALLSRTQLNFTVAIDFTASNGECNWCV